MKTMFTLLLLMASQVYAPATTPSSTSTIQTISTTPTPFNATPVRNGNSFPLFSINASAYNLSSGNAAIATAFSLLPLSSLTGTSLGFIPQYKLCKDECARSMKCVGWTETTTDCEMYSKITSIQPSTSTTSYLSKVTTKTYTAIENFVGNNVVISKFLNGVVSCSTNCDVVAGCVGYGLNTTESQFCTLYSSIKQDTLSKETASTLTVFSTQSSLQKRQAAGPRLYIVIPNIVFSAATILTTTGSVDQCIATCDKTSNCVLVISGSGNCLLKDGFGYATVSTGMTSYAFMASTTYIRPFTSVPRYTGVQTPMFTYEGDIAYCPHVCSITIFCVGYLLDSLNPRICILQSAFTMYSPMSTAEASRSTFTMYGTNDYMYQKTSVAITAFQVMPDVSMGGKCVSFYPSTLDQCKSKCYSTAGCFEILYDGQSCYSCSTLGTVPYGSTGFQTYILPIQNIRVYQTIAAFSGTSNWYVRLTGNLAYCSTACDSFPFCFGILIDSTDPSNCILVDKIVQSTIENKATTETMYINSNVKLIKISNVGFSSGNLMYRYGTAAKCSAQCSILPGCFGFTLANPEPTCYFSNSTMKLRQMNGVVSYIIVAPLRQYTKILFYVGLQYPIYVFTDNANDCNKVCDVTASCIGYLIDSRSPQTCIMQAQIITYNEVSLTSYFTMYVLSSYTPVVKPYTRYITVPNTNFVGISIATDPELIFQGCQAFCASTTGCSGFTNIKWKTVGCQLNSATLNSLVQDTNYDTMILPSNATRSYINITKFSGSSVSIMTFSNGLCDCSTVCDYTRGCIGYSIDSTAPSDCKILSLISQATSINASSTVTMNIVSNASFITIPNTWFGPINGGSFLSQQTGSSRQCTAMCSVMPGCLYVIIDNSGCGFQPSIGDIYPKDGVTTYLFPNVPARQYNSLYQFNGLQSQIFNLFNATGNCSQVCDMTPGCVAYLVDSADPKNCKIQNSFITYTEINLSSTLAMFFIASFKPLNMATPRFISIPGIAIGEPTMSLVRLPITQCAVNCITGGKCAGYLTSKGFTMGCQFKSDFNGTVRPDSSNIVNLYVTQPQRAYSVLTTFTGSRLALFNFSNGISDCSAVCDGIGQCTGYSTDSAIPGVCSMASNITQATTLDTQSTVTMYAAKTAIQYVTKLNTGYQLVQPISLAVSFDQCAVMCSLMPGCKGFMTLKSVGKGCLFGTNFAVATFATTDKDSFILPFSNYRTQLGPISSSNQVTMNMDSAEAGGAICDKYPGCVGYSFNGVNYVL